MSRTEEQVAAIQYAAGYAGVTLHGYFSSRHYERGLIAARVALWCGVSLLAAES